MKMWCSRASRVLVGVFLALTSLVVFLHVHDEYRRAAFARWMSYMSSKLSPEMNKLRCELLANVSGSVVELGPGTGPNLGCYTGGVTEWMGVEPNPHMHDYLEAVLRDKPFTGRITTEGAEDIASVADASVDFVVSTHVLCSVGDIAAVVKEVKRVLKPGGSFIFLEHVAAAHGALRLLQQALYPAWVVLGDGCTFRDLGEELPALLGGGTKLKHFSAPINMFLIKPHVRGQFIKAT